MPALLSQSFVKRWQEYTEELYKKDLHYPDNLNGVITHLEADILECEVKWALGSITTNWKILQEMGTPDHLTCLLRNLYVGQEMTKSFTTQIITMV